MAGDLKHLPNEIQLEILLKLDHSSMLKMRLTNRHFKNIIDTNKCRMPKYEVIEANFKYTSLHTRTENLNAPFCELNVDNKPVKSIINFRR